ncbi:hypothetical protein FQN57_007151 [Myotisia sp. PD_48]|nr:hypothetical protein FQN57_007151 [Myotisia sp. PD_48]
MGRNDFSRNRIREDCVAGIRELDGASASKDEIEEPALTEPGMRRFACTNDTEIPQLQNHCSQAATTAWKIHRENFVNDLSQLLISMKLQSSGQEETIEIGIEEQELLHGKIAVLREVFSTFLKPTQCPLYTDGRTDGKLDHAARLSTIQAVSRWNQCYGGSMKWNTFKAVCRRSGEYKNEATTLTGMRTSFSVVNFQLYLLLSPVNLAALSKSNHDVMKNIPTLASNSVRAALLLEQMSRYQKQVAQLAGTITAATDSTQKDLNRTFISGILRVLTPPYQAANQCTGDLLRRPEGMLTEGTNNIVASISLDYSAGLKKLSSAEEASLKLEILEYFNNITWFSKVVDDTSTADVKEMLMPGGIKSNVDNTRIKSEPRDIEF